MACINHFFRGFCTGSEYQIKLMVKFTSNCGMVVQSMKKNRPASNMGEKGNVMWKEVIMFLVKGD